MAWSNQMFNRQPQLFPPSSAIAIAQMEVDEEKPNVFNLARASPTKFRSNKFSAREDQEKRDKFCSKCKAKYKTVFDLKIDSLWIGCDRTDCGNNCTYWVHACCTKQHSSAMIWYLQNLLVYMCWMTIRYIMYLKTCSLLMVIHLSTPNQYITAKQKSHFKKMN